MESEKEQRPINLGPCRPLLVLAFALSKTDLNKGVVRSDLHFKRITLVAVLT